MTSGRAAPGMDDEYVPRRFCGAQLEVRLPDDSVTDLWCSDREGHAEAHSCRMWWTNKSEVTG